MNFIPGICPTCNGQLPLPSGRESIRCMYCGAEVRTDQAAALARASQGTQPPTPSSPGTGMASGGLSTSVKIAIAVVGAVVVVALISIAVVIVMLRPSRATIVPPVEPPKPVAGSAKPAPSPTERFFQNTPSDPTTEGDDTMSGLLTRLASDGAASSTAILANLNEAEGSKITYPMLKKDAERYSGQAWACKGKVLQIFEHGEHTEARIALDGWGSNVIWVEGNFSTNFVENNVVCAIGYLAGSYSYKSQAGWDITIPSLAARTMLTPQAMPKMKADAAPHSNPPVREAAGRGQGTSSGSEKDRQDKVSKAERLLNQ